MSSQIPTVRTSPTRLDFARAVVGARPGLSRETFAILWAQFCVETGAGRHCYNFNVGNVKHVDGDGFDYMALKGVWEGLTRETWERERRGPYGPLVRLSTDQAEIKAVGPGKIAVLFDPPHPATLFRAYPSLAEGVREHMSFLEKRFPDAWAAALVGEASRFGLSLGKGGYYTARPEIYVRNLWDPLTEAIGSDDFEHAIALAKDDDLAGAETEAAPVFVIPDAIERDPED